MNEIVKQIMLVASVRRAIDESFMNEDIHNGVYFDVMEKIIAPSEDGPHKDFDVVAMVTEKQKEFIQSIINEDVVRICYMVY